jgi:DNA-binding NarL/FixJ family response regulator
MSGGEPLKWGNSKPRIAKVVDGLEAIQLYREQKPDVVLMDLRMLGRNGVDATSIIVSEDATACVLVVTTLDESAAAIRSVSSGRKYVPNEIALGLAIHAIDESLTLGEIAVLKSVAGATPISWSHASSPLRKKR